MPNPLQTSGSFVGRIPHCARAGSREHDSTVAAGCEPDRAGAVAPGRGGLEVDRDGIAVGALIGQLQDATAAGRANA